MGVGHNKSRLNTPTLPKMLTIGAILMGKKPTYLGSFKLSEIYHKYILYYVQITPSLVRNLTLPSRGNYLPMGKIIASVY